MDLTLMDRILKNNHDVIVTFTDEKRLRLKENGIPVSIFDGDDVKAGWGTLITEAGFVISRIGHHTLYPWQSVLKITYWKD